jgi:hypothetical protein
MNQYFTLTFVAFVVALSVGSAEATDKVFLKSGRVLEGKVDEGNAKKGGAFILLKTESGAVYKLDKGDVVKTVIKSQPADIEYQKRLSHVRDIAKDHIELAKWCEDQERGSTRFAEQIRWHYENVIRLDPQHSNARTKLGHLKLDDGTYVVAADYKARHGYVKDRRKWISELGMRVIANIEKNDSESGSKKKTFNLWIKQASRGNVQPEALKQFCDPTTVAMVGQSAIAFANENNIEMCRLHLEAISTVNSREAIKYLAHFAVESSSQDLREHAISLLAQPQVDKRTAIDLLAIGLLYPNRWNVHMAAFAIGEICSNDDGSREFAAIPLIESLNTLHTVRIAGALEPGRMNTSFGAGGTGLNMGGGPQTKKVPLTNQPSLDALRRLFEVNFQFNEQLWQEWYVANYTLSDLQVRGDN